MEVKSPRNGKDWERLARFIASLFHGRYYWRAYEDFRRTLAKDPWFTPEYCRFIEEDGEILAHALMVRREVTVAGVPLTLGGISLVGTHPKARKRGLARRLLEEHLARMTAEDFDLAGLFGIPGYYQRYGFVSALPSYSTTIATERLGAREKGSPAPPVVIRRMRRADLAGMTAVFAAQDAGRTGAILRTPEYWSWRASRFHGALVAKAPSGEVRGYALAGEPREKVLPVLEVVADGEETAVALLRALGRAAKAGLAPEIRLLLPPSHPVARLVYHQFDGERKEVLPKDRGGQLRLINLDRTGAKLGPALTKRAAAAGFGDAAGQVEIVTDAGRMTVELPGGAAGRAGFTLRAPQTKVVRLLVGSEDFASALRDPGVQLAPHGDGGEAVKKAAALGGALFPEDEPFIWSIDHF